MMFLMLMNTYLVTHIGMEKLIIRELRAKSLGYCRLRVSCLDYPRICLPQFFTPVVTATEASNKSIP